MQTDVPTEDAKDMEAESIMGRASPPPTAKKSWNNRYRKVSKNTLLNKGQNIVIDGEDTHIAKNSLTYIVGGKSAGKSVLISTILNACSDNNVYGKYIYITGAGVDSTISENNDVELIMVDYNNAGSFISQYVKLKTEFISWCKFLIKNGIEYENVDVRNIPDLNKLLKNYCDPVVSNYMRSELNLKLDANNMIIKTKKEDFMATDEEGKANPNVKIIRYAWSFINKCLDEKGLKIVSGESTYYLKPLRYDEYDVIIIDDVGQCKQKLFPGNRMENSPLYMYLTVTRHILIGLFIAGQDVQQLPLYARKQVQTVLFGTGVNIVKSVNEMDNIPDRRKREIIQKYNEISPYMFVGYNYFDDSVFDIANE